LEAAGAALLLLAVGTKLEESALETGLSVMAEMVRLMVVEEVEEVLKEEGVDFTEVEEEVEVPSLLARVRCSKTCKA